MTENEFIREFLSSRKAEFTEKGGLYKVQWDDSIGLRRFSKWDLGVVEHRVFVLFQLQPGHISKEDLKTAWETAKMETEATTIDFIAGKSPKEHAALVAVLKNKVGDDSLVNSEGLDTALFEIALTAWRMSFFYTPSVKKYYHEDSLLKFANITHMKFFKNGSNGYKYGYNHEPETHKAETKEQVADDEWAPVTDTNFAAVAGMDDLKKTVKDKFIWPMTHPKEMERYKLHKPSGLLLTGPPGTGKTYFSRAMAGELGWSFRSITTSDLGSSFIHETSMKIHELFRQAREHQPCVLFFDELEHWAGNRQSRFMEHHGEELNALLIEMNNAGDSGVMVIAATNVPEMLDPAAIRHGRFDFQVEIPVPDARQRLALFEMSLKGRPQKSIDLEHLADISDGLVAADINFVVNDTAIQAAIAGEKIAQSDLETAIFNCKKGKINGSKGMKIGFK